MDDEVHRPQVGDGYQADLGHARPGRRGLEGLDRTHVNKFRGLVRACAPHPRRCASPPLAPRPRTHKPRQTGSCPRLAGPRPAAPGTRARRSSSPGRPGRPRRDRKRSPSGVGVTDGPSHWITRRDHSGTRTSGRPDATPSAGRYRGEEGAGIARGWSRRRRPKARPTACWYIAAHGETQVRHAVARQGRREEEVPPRVSADRRPAGTPATPPRRRRRAFSASLGPGQRQRHGVAPTASKSRMRPSAFPGAPSPRTGNPHPVGSSCESPMNRRTASGVGLRCGAADFVDGCAVTVRRRRAAGSRDAR